MPVPRDRASVPGAFPLLRSLLAAANSGTATYPVRRLMRVDPAGPHSNDAIGERHDSDHLSWIGK